MVGELWFVCMSWINCLVFVLICSSGGDVVSVLVGVIMLVLFFCV